MRLIDADELKKALAEMWYESNIRITGLSVAELIDNAPTIEPSGDLISRQWLLDLYDIDTTNFKQTAKVPLEVVIQNIKDAPSVSIQPKTIANDCDLISRQEAIKAVSEAVAYGNGFIDVLKALEKLPSADRPKGEWLDEDGDKVEIDDNGITEGSCWCSVCGEWLVASDEYPTKGSFCPNCGADMQLDK